MSDPAKVSTRCLSTSQPKYLHIHLTGFILISSYSYWLIHHQAHLGWPMDRGSLLNSPIASAQGSNHINWELVLGTGGLAGKARTGAQQIRYLPSTHQLLTYQPFCTSSMGLLCAWQERNQEPKSTLPMVRKWQLLVYMFKKKPFSKHLSCHQWK